MKVKLEQLTIGNYVMVKDGIYQVKGIHPDHIVVDGLSSNVEMSEVKAVPLTEDWLLKLNLQRLESNTGKSRLFSMGHYGLITDGIKFEFTYTTSEGQHFILNQIHRVHHLQNLITFLPEEIVSNP